MNEINKLRKQIDKIDFQLLNLLNKRSEISSIIGKEKKSRNVFRPERQAKILKQLIDNKNNKIKPQFILAFWRSIFLSQIDIQGGIKILLQKNLINLNIKTIYDYFSHDIETIITNSINQSLEKIKKNKNMFLILPYPGNKRYSNWWTKKQLEKFYIVGALPFFIKKKKDPKLVILSKYKPIIENENIFLYISKTLFKEDNLILESKIKRLFLYKSNDLIKKKNLKLFGAFPKHYEI